MNKSTQIASAFSFGLAILAIMLGIAVFYPYPSSFQLFVFRVVLALAAGGVAAMLPGFLTVALPPFMRAGGAIAVFALIYFYNPAELTVKGVETIAQDVFATPMGEDAELVEYYWRHAGIAFNFPKDGWRISTHAEGPGTGEMTLERFGGKGEQIQLLVSSLDEPRRDTRELTGLSAIELRDGTVSSRLAPVIEEVVGIDDRPVVRTKGYFSDERHALKFVDRAIALLDDNRRLEMHLTRSAQYTDAPARNEAYELILSTIQFDH